MTNISKKLKLYLYASLSLIALCVIFGTLSYLFSFDSSIGYFDTSALSVIFFILCALTVIGALAAFFIIPRNTIDGASPNALPAVLSAMPLCAICLALGIFFGAAGILNQRGSFFADYFPTYIGSNKYLLLAGGILLLISAIYFALLGSDRARTSELRALPGFAVPMACVLLVAITYFDLFVPMNSPTKMGFHFSMLAFAAFSVCELRVPLKKTCPRAYLSLGVITALCSATASIPQIAAFLGNKTTEPIAPLYALLSLCVFVYTTARLCVFANSQSLVEKESAKETSEDTNSAEKTNEALRNSDPLAETDAPAPEKDQQNSDNETENHENVSE